MPAVIHAHGARTRRWCRLIAFGSAAIFAASHALAADLDARLTADVLAHVYPDADRIGPAEGEPPAAPVYVGDEIVAYIFCTLDVVAVHESHPAMSARYGMGWVRAAL